MYLPERLQEQSFVTWNHLVKGLMQVWEMAHLLGLEQRLEQRLLCDKDATLACKLGELGNDPQRMEHALHHCLETLPPEERIPALCAVTLHRMDSLPFMEFHKEANDLPIPLEETLLDDSDRVAAHTPRYPR